MEKERHTSSCICANTQILINSLTIDGEMFHCHLDIRSQCKILLPVFKIHFGHVENFFLVQRRN